MKAKLVSEALNFERGMDSKKALKIGARVDWRIMAFEGSTYINGKTFFGTLEEAKKEAALMLLEDWDYTAYRRKSSDDELDKFWATIVFHDENNTLPMWKKKEERVRLKDIDIKELRFRNNLVFKQS